MLRSIQNLAKSLLLFGLLLMIVSACGQQASPDKPALTVTRLHHYRTIAVARRNRPV